MSVSLAECMKSAASRAIAGAPEDALAQLCLARDAGIRSPRLIGAIGHLQFELRRFEDAGRSYEEALHLDPGDSIAPYNRGVCLERAGDWEGAAEAFRKALELDSRRAGAYLGLGISQLHLGRPEEALSAFEKCLERQPFREASIRGRAVALHLLQRYEEASAVYQALLARDPQSEELLHNAILLAIQQGDYERLEQWSERLIEVRPVSAIALEGAALAAFARRDFDAAVRFCSTLVDADPDHFAGWLNCGVALQRSGAFDKAAEAYARAASLDPRSDEAFLSLGTVLHEMGRWEEARAAYERALALAPGRRIALWNLAQLCESRKDLRGAELLYVRLVERFPDAQDGWFRLGFVRFGLGDYAAAIRAFEACLALPHDCPEAVLNIGIAHWKMRNLEMAKEIFRQQAGTTKSVAALRCLAAIALEQQDYEQALALHKQMLELDEPSSELLYNLALLLQKRGRASDAVRYYRKALELRPGFPQALLNLGHAFLTLGKHEEAQAAWNIALPADAELAEQFLV